MTSDPAAPPSELAQAFVDGLLRLEREGDLEPLVALYADDAVAGNVLHPDQFTGSAGVRDFWTGYRDQFGRIESSFRNVVAADGVVALEWSSEGDVNGRGVAYAGVTVLEVTGGRVRRSIAYFDPTSFH